MSFSQEVRIKIAGDITSFRRDMLGAQKAAEDAGRKIDAAMNGRGARDAGRVMENRDKFAKKELATVEQIKRVTGQLSTIRKDQSKFDQGSAQWMKMQLGMEQKMYTLRQLQVKAQREMAQGRFFQYDLNQARNQRYTSFVQEHERQMILSGQGQMGDFGTAAGDRAAGGGRGRAGAAGPASLAGTLAGGMFKRMLFMGAGTIMAGVINSVPAYFRRQMEDAERTEDVTGSQADSLESRLGKQGGARAHLRGQRRELAAVRGKAGITGDALASLMGMEGGMGATAAGLMFTQNPMWQSIVSHQKDIVAGYKKEEAAIQQDIDLTEHYLSVTENSAVAQMANIQKVNQLRKSGQTSAVDLTKADLDLQEKLLSVMDNAKGGSVSPEERAAQQAKVLQSRSDYAAAEREQTQIQVPLMERQLKLTQQIGEEQAKGIYLSPAAAWARVELIKKEIALREKAGGMSAPVRAELATAQAEAENAAKSEERALQRNTGLLQNEVNFTERLNSLRKSGGLSFLSIAREELRLAREQQKIVEATAETQLEKDQAKLATRKAEINYGAAQTTMHRFGMDVAQTLTGQAAGGSVDQFGRALAPSETERLAQQAGEARNRARNAVLSGAPGEAAFQMDRARRLEGKVSERLSAGSAQIKQLPVNDLSEIPVKLETTNQLLGAIKSSLTTTAVK